MDFNLFKSKLIEKGIEKGLSDWPESRLTKFFWLATES